MHTLKPNTNSMSPEVAEDLKFLRRLIAGEIEFSLGISIKKQFPHQRIFDLITVSGLREKNLRRIFDFSSEIEFSSPRRLLFAR